VSLNDTEYSVSEDDGQLQVCVTLSRVTSQVVTVLAVITDGTTTGNIVNYMILLMCIFIGGEDYNFIQQSLLIPA